MKIKVFTKKGEIKNEREISAELFGMEPNVPLLNQYIHVFRSNQRQGTSKTKTRSEVSGGGKKPWAQKGTGRARHGSTRSPIWVHGGIAHGPQIQSWKLNFPTKMKSLALKSALSLKMAKDSIVALESLTLKKPSTTEIRELMKSLKVHGRILFVQKENDLNIRKSLRNLPKVKVSLAENLCIYDILFAKSIIFTEDALSFLEEKYANK